MEKYKRLKQYLIIFFITIVLIFFIEYFFKNKQRIPHKIFHHTFAPNQAFKDHWGHEFKICTDDNGFRIKCDGNSYKNFDIAFIGDSFTEGVGVNFEESFVGKIANKFPDLKIANLGVVSYSPSMYLTKVRYYLEKGITFKRLIVYVDISDIQDDALYSIENGKVKKIAYLDEKRNIASSLPLSRRIRNKLNLHFPITYKGLWILKNLILYQKQE